MKLADFSRVEALRDDIKSIDFLTTQLKGYGSATNLRGSFVDCYIPATVSELRDFYKKKRASIVAELKQLGVTA